VATTRARKTKSPTTTPKFSLIEGPDGIPSVERTPGANDAVTGNQGHIACPLCHASSASLGVDIRGRYWIYCGQCGIRIFSYSAVSADLIRAWARVTRRVPEALHPVTAAMAIARTQIQEEDAERAKKTRT